MRVSKVNYPNMAILQEHDIFPRIMLRDDGMMFIDVLQWNKLPVVFYGCSTSLVAMPSFAQRTPCLLRWPWCPRHSAGAAGGTMLWRSHRSWSTNSQRGRAICPRHSEPWSCQPIFWDRFWDPRSSGVQAWKNKVWTQWWKLITQFFGGNAEWLCQYQVEKSREPHPVAG